MFAKQSHTVVQAVVLSLLASAASVGELPVALAGTCATTVSQTEGPYYQLGSPETNDLVIPGDGPLLTLNGQVVDSNCNPIPYTWVDVWHANATGQYDNTPPYNQYRGHFFTDANGQFTLYTIRPGLYPGRTRHIHVKVDAANTALVTTQLYFPGEPQNATDGLYNPALLMGVTLQPDGSYLATFTFALPATGACTAPNVTSDPTPVSTALGGTATFSITATGSTPMTFRWRKDGVPLDNDSQISGVTTTSLTITNVTAADAGSYDCAALSSCGTDTSAAAALTVIGATVNIVSANPPTDNPFIDGQQPFRDVLQTGTTTSLTQGIGAAGTPDQDTVTYGTTSVTFSGTPSPAPTSANIAVVCNGAGMDPCPTVTGVTGSGAGPYSLTLSGPIPPQNCTTLTFAGATAGQTLQYQSLPGDVNMSGSSSASDLAALVVAINNGEAAVPANLPHYNINRLGTVSAIDVARLVQLLNGLNTTQPWVGVTVATCP